MLFLLACTPDSQVLTTPEPATEVATEVPPTEVPPTEENPPRWASVEVVPAVGFSQSCDALGCEIRVPEDQTPSFLYALQDDSETHVLAHFRDPDAPDEVSSILVFDRDGTTRIDFPFRIVSMAVYDDGIWVQDRRYATQILFDGTVVRELDLGDIGVISSIWGDEDEAWLGFGDELGMMWTAADGVAPLPTRLQRAHPIGENHLVATYGTNVYLWDRTTLTASELYGSDDFMGGSTPCSDGSFWVLSSTGLSGNCFLDGACQLVLSTYGEFVGKCVGDEMSTVYTDLVIWTSPDGSKREEVVPGILGYAGGADFTWTFVRAAP